MFFLCRFLLFSDKSQQVSNTEVHERYFKWLDSTYKEIASVCIPNKLLPPLDEQMSLEPSSKRRSSRIRSQRRIDYTQSSRAQSQLPLIYKKKSNSKEKTPRKKSAKQTSPSKRKIKIKPSQTSSSSVIANLPPEIPQQVIDESKRLANKVDEEMTASGTQEETKNDVEMKEDQSKNPGTGGADDENLFPIPKKKPEPMEIDHLFTSQNQSSSPEVQTTSRNKTTTPEDQIKSRNENTTFDDEEGQSSQNTFCWGSSYTGNENDGFVFSINERFMNDDEATDDEADERAEKEFAIENKIWTPEVKNPMEFCEKILRMDFLTVWRTFCLDDFELSPEEEFPDTDRVLSEILQGIDISEDKAPVYTRFSFWPKWMVGLCIKRSYAFSFERRWLATFLDLPDEWIPFCLYYEDCLRLKSKDPNIRALDNVCLLDFVLSRNVVLLCISGYCRISR